ncbi:MAG: hypothetical protein WDM89_01300 [Rhizomicrobium sp.]
MVAVTTECATNSAATSGLPEIAKSLEQLQSEAAARANAVESALGESNAKHEAARADILTTSSGLSSLEAKLEKISALQTQDAARVGGALDALREGLSTVESAGAGKMANAEKSLVDLRGRLDVTEAALTGKVEAVDIKLSQAQASAADAGAATEARLESFESGLRDISTKFSAATEKASETSGVLQQLLTQLADQSAAELRTLKVNVDAMNGAVESYRGDSMQTAAATKDRIDTVYQALGNIEARQTELSNLLVHSQARDTAVADAISMLEQNFKDLETRFHSLASAQTGEHVVSVSEIEPVETTDSAKHKVDEPVSLEAAVEHDPSVSEQAEKIDEFVGQEAEPECAPVIDEQADADAHADVTQNSRTKSLRRRVSAADFDEMGILVRRTGSFSAAACFNH